MTRGKHGEAAAVRHEVQERDAQIARLTRDLDRVTNELAATKTRLAEYQTKLGAWSAEHEEALQRKIRVAVAEVEARYSYLAGQSEAIAGYRDFVGVAYGKHMEDEHGLSPEESSDHVTAEIEAMRANGREGLRRGARRLRATSERDKRSFAREVKQTIPGVIE